MAFTRNFLRELGITETETIDKLMAEYGQNVQSAKAELDTAKQDAASKATEIEGLKAQLTQRDADIAALKQNNADNAELQSKLTELQTKYDTDSAAWQNKLTEQQTAFARKVAMDKFFSAPGLEFSSDYAKKAVMAEFAEKNFKLDGDNFQGASEWLEGLKKDSPDTFKAVEAPEASKPNIFTHRITGNQNANSNGGNNPFGGWNFTPVRPVPKD